MLDNINLFFFPHDGHYWRIDWFGDVKYRISAGRNSTPSIRVSLSQWPDANLDVDRLCNVVNPHQLQIYAPVGYLGKLKIGDVWRNGKLVSSPQYQTERFANVTIQKETTSIIKAGLGAKEASGEIFYLPLSAHPYHRSHTGSYCLLVCLPDDKRFIVPASELISFYFGSSSSLINALFHFPLTETELWIDAEHGTGLQESKIVLAAGISGWSASDVARMAFSPPAFHAAKLIGNSLSVACAYQLSLYPKTHFPFYGKTTLEASGVWLPFGSSPNKTFLVFKLLSCSHRFPFSKLVYEMAGSSTNTGEYSIKGLSPSPVGAGSQIVAAKRNSKKHVEEDPSENIRTVELVIERSPQFIDLEYKSVSRVEEAASAEVQIQLSPGKNISAASLGTDGKGADIRPVDLVRQLDLGKQGRKSQLFMQMLVDKLSAKEWYDKVEMITVAPEAEPNILKCFEEALWQHQLEQRDQPSRKRFVSLSNIQIGVVIEEHVKTYLLIAEAGHSSKLTHLCATARSASVTSFKSVAQEIEFELNSQKYYELEDKYAERRQYFKHLPDIATKSELSLAVIHTISELEYYFDIFQATVS